MSPADSDDDHDGEKEEDIVDFENEPIEMPIDGVLDLHTFAPSEVKELVADYIDACAEKGILEVRIIHGKGTGTLREIVHSVLDKHPRVEAFQLAGDRDGGWGATMVQLREGD